MELRDYQIEAIDRVREAVRSGMRRVILVAATGSGKTIVASRMMLQVIAKDRKALFLGHRKEILNQTHSKLEACGVDPKHLGIIRANDPRRNPVASIQIASVDTLRNRAKPPADIVFVDECHRSLSRTIRGIVESYPSVPIVGLTATPWRADNQGFDKDYDGIVVVRTPRQLIDDGWLCDPSVKTVPVDQLPDLSGVRKSGGDYNESDLSVAMNKKKLVGGIVEHWHKWAANRRTVVFAVSVEHSKHIVASFAEAGVAAEHLDGSMKDDLRDAILARLARGETRVVSSCQVLQEGWDLPAAKVAVLARPTKSLALFIQQAGRVLRPYADPETGLAVGALILDHAGNCAEHGRPDEDREYTLKAPPKRAGARPIKTCPECYAVLPASARVCIPPCEHVFRPEDDPIPETAKGELVEYTIDHKRAIWDGLLETQRANGHKDGWARIRYRKKFKQMVPREFPESTPTYAECTEEEKRQFCRDLREQANREGRGQRWIVARFISRFKEEPPLEIVRGAELREAMAEAEKAEWTI